MKIGILTYHRAHNYGAMLQAYALQHFLLSQGHQAEFIDYWPKEHADEYSLWRPLKGTLINKLLTLITSGLTFWRRRSRIQQFKTFMVEYLGLPAKAKYSAHAAIIYEHYDCVIVGSDQIWRNRSSLGKYYGFDPTFFCQTLAYPARCISYAASMGVIQMDELDRQRFKQYLSAFHTIFVREQSLCQVVNDMGFPASVVLDPTLLFTKEQWNVILPKTRFCTHKYVLYYQLMDSKEALAFAKQQAKQRNCQLLIMDARISCIQRPKHISFASPIGFMQAIRDAEFVVPTSFHGTAFSLIFEKQFVATGLLQNADRVQTLLRSIGIPDNYQDIPTTCPLVDYMSVHTKLTTCRAQSQRHLLQALEAQSL
ncbi:MAG: polysaccharide pyruvyl transferase family protein [Paludibacteraceae bacterium]